MTMHNQSSETPLSTADFANPAERRTDTPSTSAVADKDPVARREQDRGEDARHQPLFNGTEGEQFRGKWTDIQASFVDEPRRAVEQADSLVAEVMQRLAQGFASERKTLEQQWDRGGETDTEELRLALRRYRTFFDRLLTM